MPQTLMPETLVTLLGWTLAVAASLIVVPQLVHLLRTGTHHGVSLRSAVLAVGSCSAWLGYTFSVRDLPAFASSAGPLVVWLAVGSIVSHRRGLLRRYVTGVAAGATTVVLLGSFTGGFHVLAVSGSLVWIIPQALAARRLPDLSGVSVTAYGALFLENLAWVIYAWGTGHLAYAVPPIVQAPFIVVVVLAALRSRRGGPIGGAPRPGSSVSSADHETVDALDLELELLGLDARADQTHH